MMYLTIKAVSLLLSINEKTIYSWTTKGTFPYHQFGHLKRIPIDGLARYIVETGLVSSISPTLSSKNNPPRPISELIEEVRKEIYNLVRGNRTKIEPSKKGGNNGAL